MAAAIAALLCFLSFVLFVGHLLKSFGIDTQAFLPVLIAAVPFLLAAAYFLLGFCWFIDFVNRSKIEFTAFFEMLLISATNFVSSSLSPSAPPPRARQGATG